jgi:hypothetical protein
MEPLVELAPGEGEEVRLANRAQVLRAEERR